jgi:ribosomal protein S14
LTTKATLPKSLARNQTLILNSLKLPKKSLVSKSLKSGVNDLFLSPRKKKIKKETQNLRTVFQEASFSPLFSLQEDRNKKLVENQGLRAVWKAKVINSSVPAEKRKEAMQALAQLPKNPLHAPRLCILSGRSKGVYKKFRLSRHNMRSLLGQGILQGVKKASW